jgi:uncharacterized protein
LPDWSVTTLVALAAFMLGLVFGAVAQRTHFCTMGAISDAALFGSFRRLRAWVLAVAVALVLGQALHLAGLVDLGRSIYQSPDLGWLGHLLGGFLFGFGMVLAGGCASRNLVRLGAGSLKALVVLLVLGLVAFMTLSGLLAPLRLRIEALGTVPLGLPAQGLAEVAAAATGLADGLVRSLLMLVLAAALAAWCLRDPAFRRSTGDVVAGVVIGLLVGLGWVATGVLGADDFDPTQLASLTFVAPTGQSLLYLMTWTGATIGFGVASVLGVVTGACLAAVASGGFRLDSFAGTDDLVRNLAGAALMGFGGVLALGCTIGQGITGLSTLAVGSLLAVAAIVLGALAALRYLQAGSLRATLRPPRGRATRSADHHAADPCAAALPRERP